MSMVSSSTRADIFLSCFGLLYELIYVSVSLMLCILFYGWLAELINAAFSYHFCQVFLKNCR